MARGVAVSGSRVALVRGLPWAVVAGIAVGEAVGEGRRLWVIAAGGEPNAVIRRLAEAVVGEWQRGADVGLQMTDMGVGWGRVKQIRRAGRKFY